MARFSAVRSGAITCSALALIVVTEWPSISDGRQAPSPPPKAPAVASVPRIPVEVVARLLTVGSESASTWEFLGIHKIEDDSRLLSISSGRQSIAFAAASGAQKGGRYTPPVGARADIVTISCGDEDLGERWDCARVSVVNVAGRRVAPLSYSGGPKAYRNALGATWTATLATASYRLSDLTKGFEVRYAGTDGTDFTEKVSAADVAAKLFSELPPTKAMRDAVAAKAKAAEDAVAARAKAEKDAIAAAAKALIDAEPEPPALLRGTLEGGGGDTWTITSASPSYTWRSCDLISGTNKMSVGPLAPGLPVTVTWPAMAETKPLVHCLAKGRHVYGPVPAEFVISVERQSAEFWIVRNLTDWEWKACEIVVAEKSAVVETLSARGTVTVTAGNFRPGPPRADAAPSVTDLTLFCTIDGHRVDAVQRPTR